MKVFISWSGEISQQIGEELKNWLPAVLQNVKPYFTPNDIEKGSRWNADISNELEQSKLGIFIYTKENLDSQWMLFEAGAISKTLDNSKVCPILFGLDNSDFKGPLTQFQTCQFSKTDFKKLVRSINNSLSELKLEEKVLEDVFDMWWPKLELKISKILETNKVANSSIRDDRELLEEILALSRVTAKRITVSRTSSGLKYDPARLEGLASDFLTSTQAIFDWDWSHTKLCLATENIDMFIADNGDFLNPKVDDEGNNWANRASYLNAFRRLSLFMELHGLRKEQPLFPDSEDLPF